MPHTAEPVSQRTSRRGRGYRHGTVHRDARVTLRSRLRLPAAPAEDPLVAHWPNLGEIEMVEEAREAVRRCDQRDITFSG